MGLREVQASVCGLNGLRVGFVGLGHNGIAHAKAHRRVGKSVVQALCDRNATRLAEAGRELGVTRLYEGDEIYSDPTVDAISIHTGDPFHVEPFLKALEHGKHVLVEKPVANSIEQLRQMADAARQADRRLKIQCGYVLRFDAVFEAVQELCRKGMIGRIFYMEADYIHNLHYQKDRADPTTGRNWYLEEEQPIVGGGSHELDLLRWFSGREVVETTGYANHVAFPEMRHDDLQVALFRFDDGAVAKVAAAYGPMTARPPYANLVLYSTRGTVKDDSVAIASGPHNAHPAFRPIGGPRTKGHPFEPEIADWLAAIAEDRPTRCGFFDGANSTAATLVAVEAIAQRRPLPVPVFTPHS